MTGIAAAVLSIVVLAPIKKITIAYSSLVMKPTWADEICVITSVIFDTRLQRESLAYQASPLLSLPKLNPCTDGPRRIVSRDHLGWLHNHKRAINNAAAP